MHPAAKPLEDCNQTVFRELQGRLKGREVSLLSASLRKEDLGSGGGGVHGSVFRVLQETGLKCMYEKVISMV